MKCPHSSWEVKGFCVPSCSTPNAPSQAGCVHVSSATLGVLWLPPSQARLRFLTIAHMGPDEPMQGVSANDTIFLNFIPDSVL